MNEMAFCRVNKAALKRITDTIEGTDACFAVAVYTALCSLANSNAKGDQTKPFMATIKKVATYSGLRYRKTIGTIHQLRDLGLLKIQSQVVAGSKMRAPSLFTLCTIDITLCTEHDANHADSSNNTEEFLNGRKDETGCFGKQPVAVEEKGKAKRKTPNYEEVCDYACSRQLTCATVDFWWNQTVSQNWKIKDKLTHKMKPIVNWRALLEGFCASVGNPPTRDKISNEDFWQWVRDEDLNEEYVNEWVDQSTKHNWQRLNKMTDDMEPIFDFKKSCMAFVQKLEADCDSLNH